MDEKQIYHYQIETWYFNHRVTVRTQFSWLANPIKLN